MSWFIDSPLATLRIGPDMEFYKRIHEWQMRSEPRVQKSLPSVDAIFAVRKPSMPLFHWLGADGDKEAA